MSEIPTSMNTDSQDTLPTLSENILGEFNDSSGFLKSLKIGNEDVYISLKMSRILRRMIIII